MKRLSLPLFALSLLFLSACGGGSATLTDGSPQETLESIPDWCVDIPDDPNYLFSCSTATSRDLQLAINKAKADGRNEIAQQLEVKYNGLTKRFQEEVGLGADSELLDQYTQVYKSIVSQTLNGSRVNKQEVMSEPEVYRAFVLVEMPIGEANQALMSKIKANENMYTRFRASQAFKELDDEIEKYEEWKKEQMQGYIGQ